MKKFLAICFVLCLAFAANLAAAQDNEREGVLIDSLSVKSKNTVRGKITAEDASEVGVGNVELSNTQVNNVDITTENETGEIEAINNSKVSVGSVKLKNVEADSVSVDSKNKVTGKIYADDGTVNIGGVELNNYEGGTVDIKTDNTVQGGVRATNGSSVKVGGVTSD